MPAQIKPGHRWGERVLLALTWLPWSYVVLTRSRPGAGDYLLGRISDAEFLERSGVVTPVVKNVQTSTPPDARIWLWCGEQTFYLERWARASNFLDRPLFLTWFEKYGERGLSRKLAGLRPARASRPGDCERMMAAARHCAPGRAAGW